MKSKRQPWKNISENGKGMGALTPSLQSPRNALQCDYRRFFDLSPIRYPQPSRRLRKGPPTNAYKWRAFQGIYRPYPFRCRELKTPCKQGCLRGLRSFLRNRLKGFVNRRSSVQIRQLAPFPDAVGPAFRGSGVGKNNTA
jgi:hypothetical protein